MTPLRIGLRAKLLLVTAALAAIPLIGVGYVREMEILLREQQEQNLLAAARAVATALNDRPAMRRLRPLAATPPPLPPPEPLRDPAPAAIGAGSAISPAEAPAGMESSGAAAERREET